MINLYPTMLYSKPIWVTHPKTLEYNIATIHTSASRRNYQPFPCQVFDWITSFSRRALGVTPRACQRKLLTKVCFLLLWLANKYPYPILLSLLLIEWKLSLCGIWRCNDLIDSEEARSGKRFVLHNNCISQGKTWSLLQMNLETGITVWNWLSSWFFPRRDNVCFLLIF